MLKRSWTHCRPSRSLGPMTTTTPYDTDTVNFNANDLAHSASPNGSESSEPASGPTASSIWFGASGGRITDELLKWPPDVFALVNVVLARAEAFRFALSRQDWPPSGFAD